MSGKNLHFGDRVIPKAKHAGIFGLDECKSWQRAKTTGQNFLFVVGYDETDSGGAWILWDEKETLDGDFFKSEDFVVL